MKDDPVKMELTYKDYQSNYINDWCAGCGDHGILRALEKAMAELGLATDQTAVFGGIGCSGKTPYYLNTCGVHTLHGRVLSFAAGAKLANPALNVIAIGGDGDGLSIGAGHFVNSGRRNLDMLYIMFNNGVYGLTKGQPAPTLRIGEKTRSMARSNIQAHVNPVLLAMVSGYTWIGRGYAYDVAALSGLISAAIQHPGIAFLDVLQPCPKYNDIHTRDWYADRLYTLQDDGHQALITPDTDAALVQQRFNQALILAQQWGERIPVGIFLQDLSRPDFQSQMAQVEPACADRPPCRQAVADASGNTLVDLGPLFGELKI
ncbi:MAG: thiamine pyrophosphate-dependent enzyme [Gammaproteobacteria bacterium]|jgi:2-oxoglutarate ferredoxin oxidoreductase subunit beta